MHQILKIRQAAIRLTRQQFDALTVDEVSAIAQAFYLGGKIYSKADRERVWKKLQEKRQA